MSSPKVDCRQSSEPNHTEAATDCRAIYFYVRPGFDEFQVHDSRPSKPSITLCVLIYIRGYAVDARREILEDG